MTLRRKDLYFPIRKLCNIMLNVGHLKKGGVKTHPWVAGKWPGYSAPMDIV